MSPGFSSSGIFLPGCAVPRPSLHLQSWEGDTRHMGVTGFPAMTQAPAAEPGGSLSTPALSTTPSLTFSPPRRPQGESCLLHVEPEILVWPVGACLASENVPEPPSVRVRAQ